MQFIHTESSKDAMAHYSPGVLMDGTLYISGQLPIDPKTGKKPERFEDEVQQALQNVENVLKLSGMRKEDVLMCRAYISDIALWDAFNQAYGEWFKAHRPARIVIPCGPLHYGCRVEIEAVAKKGSA